jgi:hypothetical protein
MASYEDREIQTAAGFWKDLDAELSEWDSCQLYKPGGVAKRLVQQLSAANLLLARIEIAAEVNGNISVAAITPHRCNNFRVITRWATGTQFQCEKCVKRSAARKPVYDYRPDPDC